jgi:pimeloyl-ACP methyl ester carboxylesterase
LKKKRLTLQLGEVTLAYSLYQKTLSTDVLSVSSEGSQQACKRIMLLHGAGVAGELTWTFISNYLTHWDEILIPDLIGMGESFFESSDRVPFTISDICQGLFSLLRHLNWQQLDLAGYSLGGLVALELNKQSRIEFNIAHNLDCQIDKLCLIEPALFSDASLKSALNFRQSFDPIAKNICSQPESAEPFLRFLDLVSPNRMRLEKTDQLAVKRLQVRPYGFANALLAVSDYAKNLNDTGLKQLIAAIPEGVGIVGGLSSEGLVTAQESIKRIQPGWSIEVLPSVDHSLVYVRPKQVARLMNYYLE